MKTATEYHQMLSGLLPEDRLGLHDEATVKLSILYELMPMLPKKTLREYSERLEREREHFARADQPGHETWYPLKLQKCFVWKNMLDAET